MTNKTGRCLCGAVSYSLSADPLITRVCWCRDCQRISANGTVNSLVATEALEISGTTAQFTRTADSGNHITHRFCATCGTHLFANSAARLSITAVRVGTLDDTSAFPPTINMWASHAPGWACLDDSLERAEEQPPSPQTQKNASP